MSSPAVVASHCRTVSRREPKKRMMAHSSLLTPRMWTNLIGAPTHTYRTDTPGKCTRTPPQGCTLISHWYCHPVQPGQHLGTTAHPNSAAPGTPHCCSRAASPCTVRVHVSTALNHRNRANRARESPPELSPCRCVAGHSVAVSLLLWSPSFPPLSCSPSMVSQDNPQARPPLHRPALRCGPSLGLSPLRHPPPRALRRCDPHPSGRPC